MNLEQYKKKMKCVKTKFEHIGQNTQGKAVFDWYVDWKRGIVFRTVTHKKLSEGEICNAFEYKFGGIQEFNEYESMEEYTTEIKRLDSWK